METAKRNFADAIRNDRVKKLRRMFWRGGRAHEDIQDKDLEPDGRVKSADTSVGEPADGHKKKHVSAFADGGEVQDTSGAPQTDNSSQMRAQQYATGGEVEDTSGAPQTDDASQMRRQQYADGGEVQHPGYACGGSVRYADGGEVQHPGYARGGYVGPPVHEEKIDRFGPEPEDSHDDDPMKMVAILKKRRRRF